MRIRFSVLGVLVVGSFASAQGTPADYEHSARMFALTRDKVYRTECRAALARRRLPIWYRVDLPDKAASCPR